MNNRSDEETPAKRHYVPVLPPHTEQQQRNAKKASIRSCRNKRIARKLDEVLGSVEDE